MHYEADKKRLQSQIRLAEFVQPMSKFVLRDIENDVNTQYSSYSQQEYLIAILSLTIDQKFCLQSVREAVILSRSSEAQTTVSEKSEFAKLQATMTSCPRDNIYV